jgi:MEMO1 family protein
MAHRSPAVAGQFYPKQENKLREMLKTFHSEGTKRVPRIAIMAPHAGYIYSGRFAGKVFEDTEIPESVVILCPNHTGRGKRISLWAHGEWETPLGNAKIDEPLARHLMEALQVKEDLEAHRYEHAIEVQVPFLQFARPDVKIVPIVLGPLDLDECKTIGTEIANALTDYSGPRPLLIASSDMSHYISALEAKEKDSFALSAIEDLDPEALYSAVVGKDISMCGFIPTTVVLQAAKKLGAKESKIVCYGHSGEVTGDENSVVAYASAKIH